MFNFSQDKPASQFFSAQYRIPQRAEYMKMAISPKYRSNIRDLLESKRFLGEAGLETTLIFEKKFELPCFASFLAVMDKDKLPVIEEWQKMFLGNARQFNTGYWLNTKTWRANSDWGKKLDIDLNLVWKICLQHALEFRDKHETSETPIIVSGVVGPRRDGYTLDPSVEISVEDAKRYHRPQIEAFKLHGADVITVYTMTHYEEAAGIALACKEAGMPLVMSFTIETNGMLVSGESLPSVIKRVHEASGNYPLFYMINCAHPSHMEFAFRQLDATTGSRLRGFFPNSSKKSHAELNESIELDSGEPDKIGMELFSLLNKYSLTASLVGGCCGTGLPHICSISTAYTQ